MPWTYNQKTGTLLDPDGKLAGKGYSGHGAGVNNPAAQDQHNVGPIPQGYYSVGVPFDGEHGPFTLPLSAFQDNEMFGRDGFLMHGDRVDAPGQHLASLGCIIMGRDVREAIWNDNDHIIQVLSGEAE